MLRDPRLTDGIGVRIAHNIPYPSMQDALRDHDMTSVTSAKQRKKNKSAQPEELVIIRQESQSNGRFFWFCTNYFRFAEQLLMWGVSWVF
jgi:hypothetical protein